MSLQVPLKSSSPLMIIVLHPMENKPPTFHESNIHIAHGVISDIQYLIAAVGIHVYMR
jgi:hypothetical protein